MTRVKISAAILLLLVGISVLSGIWTDRNCRRLSSEAQEISETLEAGNINDAENKAALLCRDWKRFRTRAALVVRYDKLMETDRIAAHFDGASKPFDDDVLPELAEFRYMLNIIRRNELPFLTSLL